MIGARDLIDDYSGEKQPQLRVVGGRQDTLPQRLLLSIADTAGLHLAYAGNMELLHSGDAHFKRLAEAFAAARHEISVELYMLRPDPVGWQLVDALVAAAERGVRVRLLLDPFGSRRVTSLMAKLRKYGAEVSWYNPYWSGRWPMLRTHRKLVLIDGRQASIGGMNWAAEFSEQHSGAQTWRDISLWLEGPVVSVLRHQLEISWQAEGGKPGRMLPISAAGHNLCAVAGGRDGRGSDRNGGHGWTYLTMVEAAKRQILLATPYFAPQRRLRDALVAATRRGVQVVVVIPRRCDLTGFKHGGRHLYHRLLQAGVEIRERNDRMVHAKVAVIDNMLAAVGSVNLNHRSLRDNSETLLLTTRQRIVAEVRRLIVEEASEATEVLSETTWSRHPNRCRISELMAIPVAHFI